MTDQEIIRYIDQMCVKDGDIEVKNICKDGSYTLVVPVINGGLEFNTKQIATLEMESYFDGEEMVLLNFPKNLLSDEDYIYIAETLEDALSLGNVMQNSPSTSDNRDHALDDSSPEPDALQEIRAVAKKVREEMNSLYGDDLAGECIEASEKIVQALSDTLGIKAKTVEGWCRYDDECYGSDRPWDPHTWVEVESLQLYIDVTADQFNYGMARENEFEPVIVRKGIPHGMQYEEPSWNDFGLEADESVMGESLEFIFDEEITVSDDGSKLEGYLWAVSSLVARLKAQEPPLEEDQFMENVNFYPVYDVANGKITLEGHYYLEDAHYAKGRGFVLPLTPEESIRLMDAFETYCLEREGKSCLSFLNDAKREQEPGHKTLEDQIRNAENHVHGLQTDDRPTTREPVR